MDSPTQDRHYLDEEADAFFERNRGRFDARALRPSKRVIVEQLDAAGVRPRRVLEYGCNYGDLLAHYAARDAECHGVEPSAKAIAFGRERLGGGFTLHRGTIADNPVNADPANRGRFDLVVIDDVLCWVSRPTLFQSIANVDAMLADGGYLFLREFYPLRNTRNRNHHVSDAEVWCYKPAGPHLAMFTASGTYQLVSQRVEIDGDDAWARQAGGAFESRWSNAVLRKSFDGYFEQGA